MERRLDALRTSLLAQQTISDNHNHTLGAGIDPSPGLGPRQLHTGGGAQGITARQQRKRQGAVCITRAADLLLQGVSSR
eukprot:14278247-Heterocapsa_arctica.AAC.1